MIQFMNIAQVVKNNKHKIVNILLFFNFKICNIETVLSCTYMQLHSEVRDLIFGLNFHLFPHYEYGQ